MASNNIFLTLVSSKGAFIQISDGKEQSDITSNLQTGSKFDSLICDGPMQEVQNCDNMLIDSKSLDYLFKCAESNKTHDLRDKESLFIKFDTLLAKTLLTNSMEEKIRADTENDAGYETGSSNSVIINNVPATSKTTIGKLELPKSGTDKPTLMVSPIVNFPYLKPKKWQATPTSVFGRSISCVSIPSHLALARLARTSRKPPHKSAHPHSPCHNFGYSLEIDLLQPSGSILQKQEQQKLQLLKENMELMSYKRINEDLKNRIKKVSEEKEMLLHREFKLTEQIKKKDLSNKQITILLEEYVKIISSQIDEHQEYKSHYNNKLNMLTTERDMSLKHLATIEGFFNNILTKYETCRSLIYSFKDREKALHQSLFHYEEGIKKYKFIFNKLKAIASESLRDANKSLDNIRKKHSIEIAKLKATIKKSEVTISSLQEMLTLKIRDNEKLSKICGQLTYESH